jgi:hypothetical protein
VSSLELIWLDTTGSASGLPFWTVASTSVSPTTRAITALAGFSISGLKLGSLSSSFNLQTLEVRSLIRNFSSLPGGVTWVSVEVLPRLSSGGVLHVTIGDFQVALLLVHDDGSSALGAGTASVLEGQAPPVPLDDSTTTIAAGLVAGFSTTFVDTAQEISSVGVQGVAAVPSTGPGVPTVQLQGTASATAYDSAPPVGSVDVAFLAWAAGQGMLHLPLTIGNADLLANNPQRVTFEGSADLTSAVVALTGFQLGWSSAVSGSQEIFGVSVQITNLAWSGNTVTFNASAAIPDAGGTTPDQMSLQLAVFATT